jgi:hypothetical protein
MGLGSRLALSWPEDSTSRVLGDDAERDPHLQSRAAFSRSLISSDPSVDRLELLAQVV